MNTDFPLRSTPQQGGFVKRGLSKTQKGKNEATNVASKIKASRTSSELQTDTEKKATKEFRKSSEDSKLTELSKPVKAKIKAVAKFIKKNIFKTYAEYKQYKVPNKPLESKYDSKKNQEKTSLHASITEQPADDPVLPPMNFDPALKLTFHSREAFNKFKAAWLKEKISKEIKIAFQPEQNSVYVPYTGRELMALAKKLTFLQPYFGSQYYNVFEGYSSDNGYVYVKTLGQNEHSLMEEANMFLSHFEPKKLEVDMKPSNDPIKIIQSLLTEHTGLLIGEAHNDHMPKTVLIDNMKLLKQNGVDILFMEHLFYDTIQKDLDAYNSNPKASMPRILEAYLDSLDAGFRVDSQSGYRALISAAHKNGIRVVALDTAASYKAGYDQWSGKSKGQKE